MALLVTESGDPKLRELSSEVDALIIKHCIRGDLSFLKAMAVLSNMSGQLFEQLRSEYDDADLLAAVNANFAIGRNIAGIPKGTA